MKTLKKSITDYFQDTLAGTDNRRQKFFIVLNLLLPVFMGLYVFLNPYPVYSLQEALFYLSVVIVLLLIILRKTDFTLFSPFTLPFVLFFAWSAFGLIFALDFANSVHDLRVYLLKYFILFYLLVNYFKGRQRLEALSWIIISSLFIFSVGAITYYYFIEGHSFKSRLGTNFSVMYTGTMVIVTVAALPLMLRQLYQAKTIWGRLLFGFATLMTILATLLSQSRAALVGLMAAFLIFCLAKRRAIVLAVIAILLVVAIPGVRQRMVTEGATDIRSSINLLFWEIVKDYPITGVGFGISIYNNPDLIDVNAYNEKVAKEYRMEPWYIINTPHNVYMDVAVRTGLIGLMIFLSIPIIAAFLLWRVWKQSGSEYYRLWAVCLLSSLGSVLAQGLFHDLYYPSWFVFYTLLAMIAILWNTARKDQPPQKTCND